MKTKKWLKLGLLSMLSCVAFFAVGCNDTQTEEEEGFTGFLKGYRVNVELGSELRPEEYAEIVSDSDYTITIASKDGEFSEDVTSKKVLDTSTLQPGAYTITYKVNGGENKGTYTCDINIVVPKIKVQYKLYPKDMVSNLGDTLDFDEYISELEWDIKSYYDYTFRPDYVWIGEDQEEDLTGKTSFTFTKDERHAFHFTIITDDGQTYPVMLPMDVVELASEAQTFMQANNMSAYEYEKITADMGVQLKAGFSRGGSNQRQNVGYVAFEGNYGAGNYVKIDFTGNNLPKIAFFASTLSSTLNDGTRGVYVANGHWHEWKRWQGDQNAYTVYGPNKVPNNAFSTSSKDVLWSVNNVAIAGAKLETTPDTPYQYIVGVRETKDASQVAENQTPYMILECLLVNRTTQEIVYECEQKIENKAFDDGYFKGHIIAYGNFGFETTFDKVYPLQTATSIWNLYEGMPRFNTTAPTSAQLDTPLEVSDFVSDLPAGSVLGYIATDKITPALLQTDDNGKVTIDTAHAGFVDVTGEASFSFAKEGAYTMYYQDVNKMFPASMQMQVKNQYVVDFEDGTDPIGVCNMSSETVTVDGVTSVGGNKMMKITGNWSTYIGISAQYVHSLFAKASTYAMQFKLYTDKTFATSTAKSLAWYYTNALGRHQKTDHISFTDEGDHLLITFTRDAYDLWAAGMQSNGAVDTDVCQFLFRLGADNNGTAQWGSAGVFYLDDFMPVKETVKLGSDKLFVAGTPTGNYKVSYTGVYNNVTLNGTSLAVTAVEGGFEFSQALLSRGVNTIEFIDDAENVYEYKITVTSTLIDFEDGTNPIITAHDKDDTMTVVGAQSATAGVPVATDSYTLKFDPGDWSFGIGIDIDWMKQIFANTSATDISFKVYTDKQWANIKSDGGSLTAFQLYSPNGGCQVWTGYTWTDEGDYLMVTLSKEKIQEYFTKNEASTAPADVMVVQMRLGVLDVDSSSATYNKVVWGSCDFVYLDDFQAVLPQA